ncbi:MAG: ASCH domain-containing protein [Maritimibacter sp.]
MTNDMEDLQDTYPGAGTFVFSEDEALNVALLKKVRNRSKTANCAALAEFADDMGALPKAGRCDIAANLDGSPAVVVRTQRVERIKFSDVTEKHAKKDGAKSLEKWQKARRAEFERAGTFDADMMLVFETFELVEDMATRPGGNKTNKDDAEAAPDARHVLGSDKGKG